MFTRPAARSLAALLVVAATLFLPLTAGAAAQVADAVIEVLLVDQTGNVLPGAAVTISRPETGFSRALVADETGMARLPAVPPGDYVVKVELSGFAGVEQPVTVRVGQTARLSITMRVAGVGETVTVEGASQLVDVYKTDSSTNIVPEQIEALPVQDRDFQRLAFLAPGVQRERGGIPLHRRRTGRRRRSVTPARRRSWWTASTSPIRSSVSRAPGSRRTRSASSASSRTGSTRRSADRRAAPCRSSPNPAPTT